MPIRRISIHAALWRKIISLSERPQWKQLTVSLQTLPKVTFSPKKDAIVWNPTHEFEVAVFKALSHEIHFVRNKTGVGYQNMMALLKETEAAFKKAVEDGTEQVEEPDSEAGQETETSDEQP